MKIGAPFCIFLKKERKKIMAEEKEYFNVADIFGENVRPSAKAKSWIWLRQMWWLTR